MNYTAILKRALNITWRRRALWVFGILLALFGGGGGNGGGSSHSSGNASQALQNGFLSPQMDINWAVVGAIVLGVLALILVLIVISIIVRYVSTGALIAMVDEIEETDTTSVRSGFRAGWARFLHLFAIGLVLGVPVAIALIALLLLVLLPLPVIILAARTEATPLIVLGVLAMIGLFLLWLLIAIVIGAAVDLLTQFVYRRCVLAQEGVFESIRQGVAMIRRNLRDAGLTWLLLFGIELAVGMALVPVVLVGLALIVAVGGVAWAISGVGYAMLAALPLLVLFIAAAVFVQALCLIFESAVWTLVYREISAREAQPMA